MKRIFAALLSLTPLVAFAQLATVEVKNPTNVLRQNVAVTVQLPNLPKGDYSVTEHIVSGNRPELLQEISSQRVEEGLVFVADVPAKTTRVFTVQPKDGQQSVEPTHQVYAQLKLRDQKLRYPRINSVEFAGSADPRATYDAIYGHGAMWESEYVGFRVYMDNRQSIDLYGKKYPQLELDTTNFYSNRDFLKAGYGEDILWAGQSIGAGSFRGLRGGQPVYIDSVGARGQRVVEAGPIRTIVEAWDKDWCINGKTLQMKQVYTMWAGHRDVQVDIYLEGTSDKDVFATGVQKIEMENEGFVQKDGLVGSWGKNIPEKGAPDLVEGLGIGVYVEPQYVVRVLEDELNYLVHLHPVDGHIRYYLAVAADMQAEGGYHNAKDWFDYLKSWREELRTPLKKTISSVKSGNFQSKKAKK